jgi:hypothetical protein
MQAYKHFLRPNSVMSSPFAFISKRKHMSQCRGRTIIRTRSPLRNLRGVGSVRHSATATPTIKQQCLLQRHSLMARNRDRKGKDIASYIG